MPAGLKRHQNSGHDHAINFCCYEHRPYLNTPEARAIFERSLERTRQKYKFEIYAYVVMPDHVHLLISEPPAQPISKAMLSLKLSVAKQLPQRPFWQDRYYDFNVFTHPKFIEKLNYIHENPVRSGLVESPEHWPHSSYRTYLSGTQHTIQITIR